MKLKNSYFYTLREDVKDEESVSGNLLVRSGMIRKTSAGVYMYLPLGLKVLENIKTVIRDEMTKALSMEVLMPTLIPEEVYEKSGRLDKFGKGMFRLNDRWNKKMTLGPTHEELFALAASYKIKSYKDLPLNLFQIQTKFRDEMRPRYGLIRVKEFPMKDAYTFDVDQDSLDITFERMKKAYENIFDRTGVKYANVISDVGVMGGDLSLEYQAITDIGEDSLFICDCGYASNQDIATHYFEEKELDKAEEKELVHTPDFKTINDVAVFLNVDSNKCVKALIYNTGDSFVCALTKGNDEVNETKLAKILKVNEVTLASEADVAKLTKSSIGFVGPIDLNIKVIADMEIKNMSNFIVGANRIDYHYKNVNLTDFECGFYDIRNVKEGDLCPECKSPLKETKGIEVGNIFKLGTKYSEAFGLSYLDKDNKSKPIVMGSYGIGIGRVMASTVEQNNDENGIIWSTEIAPYKVAIIIVNTKDENAVSYANELYEELNSLGIDTILDDRDERVGVKFKDIDLIGIPNKVIIGRGLSEGKVEFKKRTDKDSEDVSVDKIIEVIKNN